MSIKGIISDMDGVILDTEKLYVRCWCEAGQFYGYPMHREHALGIRSLARRFATEKLQGWFGESFDYDKVRNKRIELMDNYISKYGIEPKSGAKELLEYCRSKGYKVALATATQTDRAESYLKNQGLLQYFDEVVSAHSVKNGKPEPDIYLSAAERLGLSPGECLALEDSKNGLLSALSAGCKTVMVPDLDGPDEEIKPCLYAVADGLLSVIELLRTDEKQA